MAFHPNGTILACASAGAVCLYDWSSGALLHGLTEPAGWNYAVTFSPDRQLLFVDDETPAIHVWRVGDWRHLSMLAGHSEGINGLCCNPYGSRLYSCSVDGSINVWNVETGACLQTLRPNGP